MHKDTKRPNMLVGLTQKSLMALSFVRIEQIHQNGPSSCQYSDLLINTIDLKKESLYKPVNSPLRNHYKPGYSQKKDEIFRL